MFLMSLLITSAMYSTTSSPILPTTRTPSISTTTKIDTNTSTTTTSLSTNTETIIKSNRSCIIYPQRYGWLYGWRCDDQRRCIWLRHVCDGYAQFGCTDGSDETTGCTDDPHYCQYGTGEPGWRCYSGECIPKGSACNSFQDCSDGSDEIAGCAAMDLVPCPTNNKTFTEKWAVNVDCRKCWNGDNDWRCDNGHCAAKNRVCNGEYDSCSDGSDEWPGCEVVTCRNDSSIVTAKMFSDGDCRRCFDEGQWRCNNGGCIHKAFLCDGTKNCQSGEDETIGCSSLVSCFDNGVLVMTEPKYQQSGQCRSCYLTHFWRCNSGQCINKEYVCNNEMFGRFDCRDGSDEEPGSGCPAKSNRSCIIYHQNYGWLYGWRCDDQRHCIWLGHVCDGYAQFGCPDGSDETTGCTDDPHYCQYETGEPGWRCYSGECISKGNVCNSFQDCSDGSDEIAGCAAMDLVPCPTNNNTFTEKWAVNVGCRKCRDGNNDWRCDNGHCAAKNRVCNGELDGCSDGSDEWLGCEVVTCRNDSSILTAKMFSDGDCRRCFDEGQWRCNNGGCIHKAFLCDGTKNCQSGEDETIGCSSLVSCLDNGVLVMTEPKYQQSGQCRSCYLTKFWRCNSGQCISKERVCNNEMFSRFDCMDGSDEEPGSGCPANITCIADTSIITTPYFSNGSSSICLSCSGDSKGKVADNYRRCKNGQCKHKVHFCNGYADCNDGSDESACYIFAYFDTKTAVMLSFCLVVLTAYLYIKYTNFHFINIESNPNKYPKKTPRLYKNIKKYCNFLELDNENNAEILKRLHNSIRNKRNGLRQLIIAITSLYEEPKLCHKYCNTVLNLENEFHENSNESLIFIRMTAGSNEYTQKFANAIEPPGFFSKLSFSFTSQMDYVSIKLGHFMHLIQALLKMVLFYLDIIKDVALFFKLWDIVYQLENAHILHHVLVYVSCLLIFLAQSIIGLYMAIQLGKPHKKLPPFLFALVLVLFFLISPLIPIVLVVKDSLLNNYIIEKKNEMKNNESKGLTKFLIFVSLENKEATETKRLFSFYKIINSVLESLPQLVIYTIFCMTYYYENSLVVILLNNNNTANIILFACSIPVSLFSVVSGINTYSSINGKSHYTKTLSYFLQIISRIFAILSFISPIYLLYFTNFKTSFQGFVQVPYISNHSWILYFLTTSLFSITYPHIASIFLMLVIIFALHGMFIYIYSQKTIPSFSDAPFFHKLTHTLANTFIVLPWRPLGQEDQRRRSREHQNYHLAMAASNIWITTFSSMFRSYTSVNFIVPGFGTKKHLEWLHFFVDRGSHSTLPLLNQLSPYHYYIGLLLNVIAHIPWLVLVLVLQGLGVVIMAVYYKKFHPWRAIINIADVNKTTRNEVLEEESEVEWVNEGEMDDYIDTDQDDVNIVQQNEEIKTETGEDICVIEPEVGEQYELQEIDHNLHIHVEIHATEPKIEHEANASEELYELAEIVNKHVPITTEQIDQEVLREGVSHTEDLIEEAEIKTQNLCKEIILELIDEAVIREDVSHTEDLMEEAEIKIQHLCKEIMLELVEDAFGQNIIETTHL